MLFVMKIGMSFKNKDGEIDAIMPLPYKNIFGFKLYTMPKQTQQLGVWIKENNDINNNKISFIK